MSTPADEPTGALPAESHAARVPIARGRLEPHEFDYVAMALTNAVPIEEIARSVGVEPAYIKGLASRTNESFNRVWDAYHAQLLNATVAWRFRLTKMLELGYAAIENALSGQDRKLAAEQAWRVLEAVVPQARSHPSGAAVQLNFGDNTQVQAVVSDTLAALAASVASLKAAVAGEPADRHVKQGSDAIIQLGIPDADPGDAPQVARDFSRTGANGSGAGERSEQSGHRQSSARSEAPGEPSGGD